MDLAQELLIAGYLRRWRDLPPSGELGDDSDFGESSE